MYDLKKIIPRFCSTRIHTDTMSIGNNKTQNMCIEWRIVKATSEPYIWRQKNTLDMWVILFRRKGNTPIHSNQPMYLFKLIGNCVIGFPILQFICNLSFSQVFFRFFIYFRPYLVLQKPFFQYVIWCRYMSNFIDIYFSFSRILLWNIAIFQW